MTYKEASNVLDDYDVNFEGHSPEEVAMAFDCAFRALEQELCDKCEAGNPCLYCKHEFEPQESEETE